MSLLRKPALLRGLRSKLTKSCWNSVWIGTASSSSRRPAPSPRSGEISMPYVASIGTYLPCWGSPQHRVAGDDEDAITLAVEAGRAAMIASGAVERVVLVSRDMPLLESSNAAVLLAGLGLDPELEVDERLGGAPATLDAVSSARPRTLVIGADLNPAGAAAILTAERGLQVRTAARVARSLPVRTRNATGDVHDYGDPRLLHERGLVASLAAAWLDTPAAEAGVDHDRAVELCIGDPRPLPTMDAGALATDYELIPLPRTGSVYTETTVHMPVPGLRTPYSLVIVELDGVGVR